MSPKGVYPHTHIKPREYPSEIVTLVRRLYLEDGMTVAEVQAELPAGFKAQRIIERHIPQRRPAIKRDQRGEKNATWRGDAIGYPAAHVRVISLHGKASAHCCVDCGGRAMDWSYIGDCPRQQRDPDNGCAYSPDPARYAPRCRPCHRQHDRKMREAS